MRNGLKIFLGLFILVYLCPSEASADVFDEIKTRADSIGKGLIQNGYIIAGISLIGFSVAAIFNKISWKTLAYIMMSCFILTALSFGVVQATMQGGGAYWIGGEKFNGSDGKTTGGEDTQSVSVPKSGQR